MIEELYMKYHRELVRWCQGMTGSLQTAEELVQEAFLRAMSNEALLSSLDVMQVRSWLYRTIKNMYVDQIRHRRHETITENVPESPKEPEEMKSVEWRALLDSLPDIEGKLIVMRYLEGYNSRQISEILSMPAGTVRAKLSFARKHLKNALGGKAYD